MVTWHALPTQNPCISRNKYATKAASGDFQKKITHLAFCLFKYEKSLPILQDQNTTSGILKCDAASQIEFPPSRVLSSPLMTRFFLTSPPPGCQPFLCPSSPPLPHKRLPPSLAALFWFHALPPRVNLVLEWKTTPMEDLEKQLKLAQEEGRAYKRQLDQLKVQHFEGISFPLLKILCFKSHCVLSNVFLFWCIRLCGSE